MKKFLVLLSILFSSFTYADTINLHWRNYDGTTYQNSTCVIDGDLIIPATTPTRYGYTFTGWKLGNYIPIEYLESTGTQYIDTGFTPTTQTKVYIKYLIKNFNSSSGYIAIYGSKDTGNKGIFVNWAEHWYVNNVYQQINLPVETNVNYEDTLYGTTWVHNAISYTVSPVAANSLNIFLFARNANNTPERIGSLQIFICKIYDNNTLVRDFIPVLDENNVPCMFDMVEGKFYYNAGTGQFIAGPLLQ